MRCGVGVGRRAPARRWRSARREAAPGGAQEGEPGGAVGGVEQGAGEGEEVEDLLALGEGFDFDGAVGDGGAAASPLKASTMSERWVRVRTRTAMLPGLGCGLRGGVWLRQCFDDAADLAGRSRGAGRGGRCGACWRVGGRRAGRWCASRRPAAEGAAGGRRRRGVGDGSRLAGSADASGKSEARSRALKCSTRVGWERKLAVRRRAVSGRSPSWPVAHGVEEALDAGLAEEVDGLLGVADEEDGLGVAVPALGEELDELVLAGGGVLHLVDEEVLEAHAGGGGEVVEGRSPSAGRLVRARSSSVKSHSAGLGEDELQLDEGTAEDAEEGLGDVPLSGG